jgi:predicted ATP-grasp superfamily ATP-dependent carboligase
MTLRKLPVDDKRVLVTEDAPSYGVLAGVRGLRQAGYAPYVAIATRDAYSRRSRAAAGIVQVPDPGTDRVSYVCALAEVSSRLGVAAVLPGTDLGLVALSLGSDRFAADVAVGTADPETVRRATDKLELEHLAADAGLATPATLHLTRSQLEACDDVPLPAVVKAARTRMPTAGGGFASSRVQRVSTKRQLMQAAAAVPGEVVLIQPALEGELTATCGVAWQGEVVAIVHQAARRIYPPGRGITAFAETVPAEPRLDAGVRRLIRSLGWSGIFQAQFVCAAGTSHLIDLNPRMYGSLPLALAAGVNMPAIWADLLLRRVPHVPSYRVGARFRSEERDLALLAVSAFSRDWRTVADVLRPHRHTAHALGSLRDPMPLLVGGRISRVRRARARLR